MNTVDVRYNKLLLKQIQKKFGTLDDLPPEMIELLSTVSQTYDYYEKERQLLERSMDLSNNELIEVNAKLEKQAEKLKRSNQELREFAFAVSHDLKEPLRTIASYIQLIELRLKGQLEDETKEFMGFAVSGVKRLQNMLEGMLRYAQVGDTQVEINKQNLNNILETVLGNLHSTINENNALIILNNPLPEVKGNRVQLVSLFQHLIANSIKFRVPDMSPVIEINFKSRINDYIFSVSDNGIGVQESNRQRLFTMFKRGHSGDYEGIGMGLSICKKIVDNHGGTIWIDDTYTKGLRIDFTIAK
jgi:light-regulated signal transduction histidine kinase (bacteriophytochrome)